MTGCPRLLAVARWNLYNGYAGMHMLCNWFGYKQVPKVCMEDHCKHLPTAPLSSSETANVGKFHANYGWSEQSASSWSNCKRFAEAPSLWSISPNDDQKPLATTCQLVGEYIFSSGNSTLPRQRGNRLIKILEFHRLCTSQRLLIVRRH